MCFFLSKCKHQLILEQYPVYVSTHLSLCSWLICLAFRRWLAKLIWSVWHSTRFSSQTTWVGELDTFSCTSIYSLYISLRCSKISKYCPLLNTTLNYYKLVEDRVHLSRYTVSSHTWWFPTNFSITEMTTPKYYNKTVGISTFVREGRLTDVRLS